MILELSESDYKMYFIIDSRLHYIADILDIIENINYIT